MKTIRTNSPTVCTCEDFPQSTTSLHGVSEHSALSHDYLGGRVYEATRSSRAGAIALALALVLGGMLFTAGTASAFPAAAAPTAKFRATCGGLGPCLVFSKGETEAMANGDVTTIVGIIVPACTVAGPFAPLCAVAASDVGPVMSLVSKGARKQGRCSALQLDGNPIQPSASQVRPTTFACPN